MTGTDERAWRAWPGWAGLPEPPLPTRGQRVVVVSAHPDDDVLAVGGLLHRLARRGCQVVLVCATDGEASHPASPTTAQSALAARRADELDAAQRRLGHGGADRVRLRLPDSRLEEHRRELADLLAPQLSGADLVLAPWTGDGHPDHEACGRATRLAAGVGLVPVWEFPLWAWHWTDPDSNTLPWPRASGVRLSGAERLAKAAAIDRFGSQVRPLSEHPADAAVLPGSVLAHFARPLEVVLT